MKKILTIFLALSLILCGCGNNSENESTTSSALSESLKEAESNQIAEETPAPTKKKSKKQLQKEKTAKKKKAKAKKKKQKLKKTLSVKYGISFKGDANDDVTGNWRWAVTSTANVSAEKYAVKYYKAYFSSDDELHVIINKNLNTSTSIKLLYDGVLDVTTNKYVKGEELSASDMLAGGLISESLVYIKSGKVEKLQ